MIGGVKAERRAAVRAPGAPSRAERLLAQFHEEGAGPAKKADLEMVRELLPYARPHALLYLVSFVLMPVSAALLVVQPKLLQRAVDAMGPDQGTAALATIALFYGAAVLGRFVASFIETYAMQLAGQRTMADLRLAVFGHIQRLSLRYIDRTPVGRLVTRATNDIDSLGELFGSGAVSAIGDTMVLAGIVIAMLSIDVKLSLVAFAVVPPLVLVVETFRRRLRAAQRRIRVTIARLNAYMSEQVQGIAVVQAFSRERECQAGYHELNLAHRDANHDQIRYDATMYSMVEAISNVCVGLLLWFAARELGAFDSAAAAEAQKGTFIAFYAYIQQFFGPIRDLSSKYTAIQSAFASAERVFRLLSVDERDAVGGAEQPKTVAPGAPLLELDHVCFRYKDDGPWVLDDVSLAIGAGETVAFVGATGAGKSTVTSLLTRFYEPSVGEVRFAGQDVRELDLAALRGKFGVVPQDPFLFAGDLLSNVAYGAPIDRARATQVLARIGALERFEARGGLELAITERGRNLSAGERQLVAFARVLYRDAAVLILDEATANIDTQTEAVIQRAQDAALAERTAIVVAHRLSTIRRADRIVVFHRGRIVEQGRHEELLAKAGVYARLYELEYARGAPSAAQVGVP